MSERFARTQLLLGREAMERLERARVAIFGIGGVGGYVAEALARSGVGGFDLIDSDTVCLTNLNRQIIATERTLGRYKVDVMKERILDINPGASVTVHRCFFLPETKEDFDFTGYSYVVDAVDTVTAKLELVLQAREAHVPIISSMGAGNKLDPTRFEVADIYETSVCPLAKVMRRELRKRNVEHLKVVYSREAPLERAADALAEEAPLERAAAAMNASDGDAAFDRMGNALAEDARPDTSGKRSVPGSVAFVPSVAGLILAGEVVKDLIRTGGEAPKG